MDWWDQNKAYNSLIIKKAFPYKQKGKQSHERIVAVGGGIEPPRSS